MAEMDFENRYVTPEYTSQDVETELSLRPRMLEDYIGQEKVKEKPVDLHSGRTHAWRAAGSLPALRPARAG